MKCRAAQLSRTHPENAARCVLHLNYLKFGAHAYATVPCKLSMDIMYHIRLLMCCSTFIDAPRFTNFQHLILHSPRLKNSQHLILQSHRIQSNPG